MLGFVDGADEDKLGFEAESSSSSSSSPSLLSCSSTGLEVCGWRGGKEEEA